MILEIVRIQKEFCVCVCVCVIIEKCENVALSLEEEESDLQS